MMHILLYLYLTAYPIGISVPDLSHPIYIKAEKHKCLLSTPKDLPLR
jgi:hypothetical protein